MVNCIILKYKVNIVNFSGSFKDFYIFSIKNPKWNNIIIKYLIQPIIYNNYTDKNFFKKSDLNYL